MIVTLAYLVLHLIAAGVVGCVTWRLVRERPRFWHRLLIPLGAMIFLIDAVLIHFRPDWIVALCPLADAVFLANVQLEGLAVMICGVVGSPRGLWVKVRFVLVGIGAMVALWYVNTYHFAPLAQTDEPNVVDDRYVVQSSEDTCAAAASATTLNLLGVKATEAEMVALCMTRKGLGTSPLGIYRGLKKKVGPKGWDVQVFYCSLAELADMPKPCLLALKLRPERKPGERMLKYLERSWAESEGHTVAYLGRDPETGRHRIADPADPNGKPVECEDADLDALFIGLVHVVMGDAAPSARLPTSRSGRRDD